MASCWRFVILLVICEIGCGVRRYLNEPEVARAVQMLEDGAAQKTIAERLGVNRSVVARLWIRDWKIQKKTWARTWETHNSAPGSLSLGTWHVVISHMADHL